MEASRLATVGERMSRLEEASRKREENTIAFIAATQTALEDKLDTTSSNREAYLNGLRAKISDHVSGNSRPSVITNVINLWPILVFWRKLSSLSLDSIMLSLISVKWMIKDSFIQFFFTGIIIILFIVRP